MITYNSAFILGIVIRSSLFIFCIEGFLDSAVESYSNQEAIAKKTLNFQDFVLCFFAKGFKRFE